MNRQRNRTDSSESDDDDDDDSAPHVSAAAAGERAFAEYLARSDRQAAAASASSSAKGHSSAAVRVYEAPVKNDLHGLGFDAAAAAGPEVMRMRARQSEREQRDATARAGSKVRWCNKLLALFDNGYFSFISSYCNSQVFYSLNS
jgi:hypothetical protein